MVKSRQDNIDALQHILTIFDHDADNPLCIALNEAGIKSISDFISMPPNDIESLTYTHNCSDIDNAQPDSFSTISLQVVYKMHIKILQGYITYRLDIDDPIADDWTNITTQQINTYVCSNHWRVYRSTKIPKAITAKILSMNS